MWTIPYRQEPAMAHELMFDDDDPVLARVRAIALALPEAKEKISHGRPSFYTNKVFCNYGAWTKHDDRQHPHSILVLLDDEETAALRERPDGFVPGYWGPWGWTGIDIDDDTDWDEIAELITESYLQTAPPKLVKRWQDAQSPGQPEPSIT